MGRPKTGSTVGWWWTCRSYSSEFWGSNIVSPQIFSYLGRVCNITPITSRLNVPDPNAPSSQVHVWQISENVTASRHDVTLHRLGLKWTVTEVAEGRAGQGGSRLTPMWYLALWGATVNIWIWKEQKAKAISALELTGLQRSVREW